MQIRILFVRGESVGIVNVLNELIAAVRTSRRACDAEYARRSGRYEGR